jgi:hypothetical protein
MWVLGARRHRAEREGPSLTELQWRVHPRVALATLWATLTLSRLRTRTARGAALLLVALALGHSFRLGANAEWDPCVKQSRLGFLPAGQLVRVVHLVRNTPVFRYVRRQAFGAVRSPLGTIMARKARKT